MKFLIFSLLSFLLTTGCAKLDGEETFENSERLQSAVYTWGNHPSPTSAYCHVQFRDPDNMQEYFLEEGSIVACDGHLATKNTNYYQATWERGGVTGPVMVSVTRPNAGSSFIIWFDLL